MWKTKKEQLGNVVVISKSKTRKFVKTSFVLLVAFAAGAAVAKFQESKSTFPQS